MQELRKLELRDKNQLEQLIEKISINLENEFFWLPITDESREHFFDDKWTYFLGMFEKEKLIAAVGLFLQYISGGFLDGLYFSCASGRQVGSNF